MAVQVIPTPVPAEPTFIEQVSSGLSVFIDKYFVVILVFFGVIIGMVSMFVILYFIKKWKENRESIFEKDYRKAVGMCKNQADVKRVYRWSMITYAIGGCIAGFSGIVLVAGQGLMGFFMSWLVVPTVIGIAVAVELLFKPFKRGDKVYMRFYEDKRLNERLLGEYRGSFYANDGFFYLLLSRGRRLLVLEHLFVIKVPKNPVHFKKKEVRDKKTGEVSIVEEKVDLKISFDDVVQFTDNHIYLNNVASIEKEEFFHYPTFLDKVGRIIDNRMLYFESDKSNALVGSMYNLTNEFSKAQSDAININPRVQYKRATDDEVIDELPKKDEDI